MSIWLDENSKVIYQGYSPGRPGSFYALRNREYGTKVVGGVNPGRAGQEHEGITIYGSVADARAATGASVSCIFVPAQGTESAVMEAAQAGIELVVVITEGVPAQDEARFFNRLK